MLNREHDGRIRKERYTWFISDRLLPKNECFLVVVMDTDSMPIFMLDDCRITIMKHHNA